MPRLHKSGNTTEHYQAVRQFMVLGEQDPPYDVTYLSEEQRLLRARLHIEETMEVLEALGVTLMHREDGTSLQLDDLDYEVEPRQMDLLKTIDGCIDSQVISTGTLVSMGIPDKAVIKGVDANNLTKFKDGIIKDDFGKILKPKDYQPPNIFELITTGIPDVDKRSLQNLIDAEEGA